MLDFHQEDRFRDTAWLVFIIFIGTPRLHGTEGARTRTHIAKDHEGSRAGAPAFAHVGAIAALADGVEVVGIDEMADLFVLFTDRQLYAKPVRFAGAGRLGLIDFDVYHVDAKIGVTPVNAIHAKCYTANPFPFSVVIVSNTSITDHFKTHTR